MTARKDSKIYVRISSKLEEQLDMLADYMGTTKSALVTYYVAQGVKQEQMKYSTLKKLNDPETMVKMMKQFGFTPEQFKEWDEEKNKLRAE